MQKASNGDVRSRLVHELGDKMAPQENQTINPAEEPPYQEKITALELVSGVPVLLQSDPERHLGGARCRGASGLAFSREGCQAEEGWRWAVRKDLPSVRVVGHRSVSLGRVVSQFL